jgi:excisionase family DNA binding protein
VSAVGQKCRTYNDTGVQNVKLIKLAEGADMVGISERTLRREVAKGTIPAYQVGRRSIRINPDDLYKLLTPITPAAQD